MLMAWLILRNARILIVIASIAGVLAGIPALQSHHWLTVAADVVVPACLGVLPETISQRSYYAPQASGLPYISGCWVGLVQLNALVCPLLIWVLAVPILYKIGGF